MEVRLNRALEGFVRENPRSVLNFASVMARDRGISLEPTKAKLRSLARAGRLREVESAKVRGAVSAKDRKVLHYLPTEEYLAALGIPPEPEQEPGVEMPVMEPQAILQSIEEHLAAAGFVTSVAEITNFFLCLQAKPFVILSGVSGTGKSRMPRLVCEAIGAAYRLIPVKPNWTDNSDLMGYRNVIDGRFVGGPLLDAIGAALNEPGRPHFVVLDEMNLAHVEHYLSDLLSLMETRRRDADNCVVTDTLPLGFAEGEGQGDMRLGWHLPWNLFLVGTVNVDETTHPFSRKVLDRAYAIDQDQVDLTSFGAWVRRAGEHVPPQGAGVLFLDRPLAVGEVFADDPDFFRQIAEELAAVNVFLRPAGLHFAYRVRDEISLYMWAWRRHRLDGFMSRDEAFDFCLLQKVLPRCQGSSEAARQALEGVIAHAERVARVGQGDEPPEPEPDADGVDDDVGAEAREVRRAETSVARYPRTALKGRAMLERYRDTGYFAFWS